MKAIGQLAGGIAHDFNNHLGGIMGYADLLLLEFKENEKIKKYIEAIITAVKRTTGLISKLLAFASKGKYQSVPVDLNKIIDDTVFLLERSIHKKVTIIRKNNSPEAFTIGDPDQLENALLNLGINARDAMPNGGEIKFSLSIRDLQSDFCKTGLFQIKQGKFVQISVTDTGSGISEDVLQHIFEPFFTTKTKGTGIGLASVYGTIKKHKGAVKVKSEVGQGTSVSLFLPVC